MARLVRAIFMCFVNGYPRHTPRAGCAFAKTKEVRGRPSSNLQNLFSAIRIGEKPALHVALGRCGYTA
jgi:hypothetical protein